MTKEQYISKVYHNEDQFQAATFQYINAAYPRLRKLVFHVPNESATNDVIRMQLKSKGVVPGIPDIVCVCPIFGLELKMPKGTQSDAQKLIERVWSENGITYALCRSAEEVCQFLATFPKLA
jgi:hypothetical protein